MKLAARDFDGFLRAPGKHGALLVYGTDAGQVRQRAEQMAESWLGPRADTMARLELTGDQLLDDPALLSDEMAAMSLMAPRRVILVREPEDKSLEAIQHAITARAPDNFLVLYSTEALGRDSKLRHWAESAVAAAALPCYKDEGAGLEQFIRDTLRGYGLRASNDVTRYLAHQLSGDRQIILNELEKLSLYMGDEAEEIGIEDAMASVGENNDRGFDELTAAIAAGDMVGLCRLTDRLLAEGNHGLLLVRSTMRYLAKLEQLALKRAEGMNLDAAIESLRPPVFFKAKPQLKSHAQRWDTDAIATALARLQMLELDSKRHADESEARLAHGLMEVAQLAGAKRAA